MLRGSNAAIKLSFFQICSEKVERRLRRRETSTITNSVGVGKELKWPSDESVAFCIIFRSSHSVYWCELWIGDPAI